jgi:hypothetical protein
VLELIRRLRLGKITERLIAIIATVTVKTLKSPASQLKACPIRDEWPPLRHLALQRACGHARGLLTLNQL